MHHLGRILLGSVLLLPAARAAGPSEEIPFRLHTLDLGRNEACAVADLNGDGRLDVISGENWYEAPQWNKHRFRSFLFWNNYIDDFSDLPIDVNGDGRVDIVSVGWGSRSIAWFENPGSGADGWKEHPIDSGQPVEFAFLVDLDNDGKKDELLPQFGGEEITAWYEIEGQGAQAKWVKHTVSERAYGHGIGAGDVNGDGRADILTPQGWLEAPEDPRHTPWEFHPEVKSEERLGSLYTYDVNQDGLNDILTTAAHGYGVFWLEQSRQPDGSRAWEKHVIDDAWSQAHAMTVADLTGDGRPELITGKRLYAHNGHDPGGRETLGLYWYEQVESGGKTEWARHIIHYGGLVGGGMQIPVVDLDADGDLDIVVAGKGGLFLFENLNAGDRR
jgi:FG-GAP-like repeat